VTKLLVTIPGIGYYSALLILTEIGDIDRFPDSYNFETAILNRSSHG
jgi:transposase